MTGLEPPVAPVVTLFMTLEQAFGRGGWLYYQLLQALMAGVRATQTANEELLREAGFRVQRLGGAIAGANDELLAALAGYVAATLGLGRSMVRVGEAVRDQNEGLVTDHFDRASAAADEGIAHLGRARLLLESLVGDLPPGDPGRALPGYVTVVQLELESQLGVIAFNAASIRTRELARYLEAAGRAAEAQRELGRRVAELGLPDAGVDEMARNFDRMGDLADEQAAGLLRMSQADLKYMPLIGDRVFLIHGHASDYQVVKDILTGMGFGDRVTVLKEEPNRGRTVLDKFFAHAGHACMAVALVTPDDVVMKGALSYGQARPNVLFEVGWFIGRFGPEKVCLLVRRETPLPSDLGGVLTLEYDDDVTVVEPELRREIEAMGLLAAPPGPGAASAG